jgi:O-antigen ligase
LAAKYVAFWLIPLTIAGAIRDATTVRGCLICLMASAVGVFFYGVYGYFTGNVGDPIEHAFGYFGVTYLSSTRNSDQLYFLVPFCVCVAGFLHGGDRLGWLRGSVVFACLLALSLAMVLSYARGAWVVMALITTLWLRKLHVTDRRCFSRRTIVLVLAVMAACVVWGVNPDAEDTHLLRERWASVFTMQQDGRGSSNESRVGIASQALAASLRNPLCGVGVGNARYHLSAEGCRFVNHAENVYLQLLLEQGVLGVAAYAVLLMRTWRRLERRRTLAATPLRDSQMSAILTALAAYGLFNNLVDNTWYWTVLALVVAHAHLATLWSALVPATPWAAPGGVGGRGGWTG